MPLFLITVNMYVRCKQYSILHYRIATNRELVKMITARDDKCSFGGEVGNLRTSSIQMYKSRLFMTGYTTTDDNIRF